VGFCSRLPHGLLVARPGLEGPLPEAPRGLCALARPVGRRRGRSVFLRCLVPHHVEPPRPPRTIPAPSGAAGSDDEAHSPRGAFGRGPRQPRSRQQQTSGEAATSPHRPPSTPPSKTPPRSHRAPPNPTPSAADHLHATRHPSSRTQHPSSRARRSASGRDEAPAGATVRNLLKTSPQRMQHRKNRTRQPSRGCRVRFWDARHRFWGQARSFSRCLAVALARSAKGVVSCA
jgi:hypothetical protein